MAGALALAITLASVGGAGAQDEDVTGDTPTVDETNAARIARLERRLAELEAREAERAAQSAPPAAQTAPVELEPPPPPSAPEQVEPETEETEEEAPAPAPPPAPAAPFSWGDFTWMNGQSRQHSSPLALTSFMTLSVYLDAYYLFSFNQPIDDTLTGTGTTSRHNEIQMNLVSLGVDILYEHMIGRFSFQYGGWLDIVQDLDGTVDRGRSLSTSSLRYIREATLGAHIDELEGINIEAGIFMSYIGLESYLVGENWNYARSIVCEHTPFYFQGVRAQIFFHNVKIEPWLMNGWQTYGHWNFEPSGGLAIRWQPWEELAIIANFYVGTDTRGQPGRVRAHHDHSVVLRYFNDPRGALNRLAWSINTHLGFEAGGDGLPGPDQAHMIGFAFAHRASFAGDLFHIAVRIEAMSNPTAYLAQYAPPGFPTGAGAKLDIWGFTATLDLTPRDIMSIRAEFVYRASNAPYFAGPGGTTSPDGFRDTPLGTWVPDTRFDQVTLSLSANFRL